MYQASSNCFVLFKQPMPSAFVLALLNAGKSSAARIAMMAMTTSSSIRVNAPRIGLGGFIGIASIQGAAGQSPRPLLGSDFKDQSGNSTITDRSSGKNTAPLVGLTVTVTLFVVVEPLTTVQLLLRPTVMGLICCCRRQPMLADGQESVSWLPAI